MQEMIGGACARCENRSPPGARGAPRGQKRPPHLFAPGKHPRAWSGANQASGLDDGRHYPER
jgi:hypothetical protein